MKTNKNTVQYITHFAQALTACAGFESITAAKSHLNSYRVSAEEKKAESEKKSLERKKKKNLERIGTLLRGAWYGSQLFQGRIGEEFRDIPEDTFQVFSKILGASVQTISNAPSALPFPVEELKKMTQDQEKEYIASLTRAMARRSIGSRKAAVRKGTLNIPEPVTTVDTKNSETNINNLIDAINKFISRNIGSLNTTLTVGDVPEFALEYFRRIEKMSPALSQAFLKLSAAYTLQKIPAEKFRYYLIQIPVIPPDDIRILFIKKIYWIQ